jgi:hypothetical protein
MEGSMKTKNQYVIRGAAMKVDFDTRQFEWSHGRNPRGYGYWAFELREGDEGIKWFKGIYADARRQARAWAKAAATAAGYAGDLTVEVLP